METRTGSSHRKAAGGRSSKLARIRSLAIVSIFMALLIAATFFRQPTPRAGTATYQWLTFERASVSTAGTPTGTIAPDGNSGVDTNGNISPVSLSSDGRFVVFNSKATDLVSPATTGGREHIYLRDLTNQTTTLVDHDISSLSAEGNNDSGLAAITPDAKWIVFSSAASDLIASDTNGLPDVFVYNTANGNIVRVVGLNPPQSLSQNASNYNAISGNGRYVYAHSCDQNYGFTGGNCGFLIHDRDVDGVAADIDKSDNTSDTLVPSLESDVCSGNQFIRTTNDGRWLFFLDSRANPSLSCYAPSNYNSRYDYFAFDRVSGLASSIVRLTVDDSGNAANASTENGLLPSVSGDGRFVGFSSPASNLVANDTNGNPDVFVHDRDVSNSGTFDTAANIHTTRESVDSSGAQLTGVSSSYFAVDDTADFVAFASGGSLGFEGAYARDSTAQATLPVSVRASDGVQFNVGINNVAISGDGSTVAFVSEQGAFFGDSGVAEVFIARRFALPTPTATATASATATSTATATATQTATPTATVTPVAGKLQVSPTKLDFGTVTVNKPKIKKVKVTNTGKISKKSHPLAILVEMESETGTPPPSPFSISTPCSEVELQPGGKGVPKSETFCEVAVQFEPTQAVSYKGTLTISDNLAPKEMQTVKLSGKGKAAK